MTKPALGDAPRVDVDQEQADNEYFATAARSYDRDVTRYYEQYDELVLIPFLDRMAAERPDAAVLDVGCGTGAVTMHLAARGFRVHATDLSPDMLHVARRNAEARGLLDRITFSNANLLDLPFEAATFDGVTSQRMLHHVTDADRALAEITRVVKPGGFLYICDILDDPNPGAVVLKAIWKRTGARTKIRSRPKLHPAVVLAPEHEVMRKASEIKRLLRAHGFEGDVRFFTHIGMNRLSPRRRLQLIKAVSLPWAKRRGDIFFATGARRA